MMSTLRLAAPLIALAFGVLAACGADGGTDLQLSPAGAAGQQLARELACASCHGANGEGAGVGPPFQGLFGSTVELDDGSTVVADEAYIVESIVDPDAKQVDGYAMTMPQRELSDEQVAAIVDYIVELGETGTEEAAP